MSLLLHYHLNKLKMFYPLQSVHHAHVVQELYGLYVLMMVESSFLLLCKTLDFASHNIHLQDITLVHNIFLPLGFYRQI